MMIPNFCFFKQVLKYKAPESPGYSRIVSGTHYISCMGILTC
jgi:hypothetical protein